MKSVRDYLKLRPDIYALRLQSGATTYNDFDGRRRFVRMCEAGTPDWLIIHCGYPLFIECKSDKGRQSATQREAEKRIRRAGADYRVIRSLQELLDALLAAESSISIVGTGNSINAGSRRNDS